MGYQGYLPASHQTSKQSQLVRDQTHSLSEPFNAPNTTIYSFIPIAGNCQQKRPRRRHEEVDRIYKCDKSGCKKAYGTLNHLNAHLIAQSHGAKRRAEEFKGIHKRYKAKKKDASTQRNTAKWRERAIIQPEPVSHIVTPDIPPETQIKAAQSFTSALPSACGSGDFPLLPPIDDLFADIDCLSAEIDLLSANINLPPADIGLLSSDMQFPGQQIGYGDDLFYDSDEQTDSPVFLTSLSL
ncbi:hypothetical protein N7520_006369 [Penicillium odoratum]|uniref:uncharacterized protein n=1 Tax=Penicillium odoratum TaxID=1167516 RepID=UPI002549B534|nr:uncharacterized protein N7520_006369 [Penicillium odoratum]KAJ5759213.1 hypothetical protein N7520_006369 [Penicillium odoratum]